MRINSVSIKNFRCYYGENNIMFNNNGKITLIFGKSGFGKSSLLQFFKWMLYGNPDFGQNDDKPLFNEVAFKELQSNQSLELCGKIEFEHLGIKYSLVKRAFIPFALRINNARIGQVETKLSILENDNWLPFNGDVSKKINSILPKELSKYFLLDGEKARDIVLDSNELKKAIHQLFGLDAYVNALQHLGTNSRAQTVINYYYNLMNSKIAKTGAMSKDPVELQSTLEELVADIEDDKEQREITISKINDLTSRQNEIFKILGEVNNKGVIEDLIKSYNAKIKENDIKVKNLKNKIGDLFYKNYPYLLLSTLTSKSATILRENNSSFADANVFENLKKDLLNEILEKDVCVCNRELDDESREHIKRIVDTMPPNSYTYQFGQFVSKARSQISESKNNVYEYDVLLGMITKVENSNNETEEEIRKQMETLKRMDAAKDLIDELESIRVELIKLGNAKAGFEGDIARKKQVQKITEGELRVLQQNALVNSEYSGKISFFQYIKSLLEEEKLEYEKKIKRVLNECVRDIFKKLTTQTELNADSIQFVNDDFSLRTTYLTGGQLAIDEYAYVIGIVKALQECEMDNNESPIIVDAPFAFTDNEQSEHIFNTLPSVSKQTVLLTLDVNKIKKTLLKQRDLYELYIINNNSQDHATIVRGDINDIKDILNSEVI